MINWYEPLPGFWLPNTWVADRSRWPDYTSPEYFRLIEEAPDVGAMIVLRGIGEPARRAWGAWLGAFKADKPLTRGWPDLEIIADKMYDTARYKFLVPAWKQAMTKLITEIDDIEDQLSTLLWVAEWVTRKWIPIPPKLLNTAESITKSVDCAGKLLAGVDPFRGLKSSYAECIAAQKRKTRKAREQKAGLLAWFRDNWGRLLEAAQATGTWFEVGIVLGPIFAWIDEGMWGVVAKSPEISNVTAEALFPGYGAAVQAATTDLMQRLEQGWDETWGSADLQDFDPETITDDYPGFWAP